MDPLALKRRLMYADAAAILAGVALTFLVQVVLRPVPHQVWTTHVWLLVVSSPVWVVALGINKLYTARANERRSEELRHIIAAAGTGVGSVIGIAFATQYKDLSRLWVFLLFAAVSAALFAERCVARRMFTSLRRSGRITRRVVDRRHGRPCDRPAPHDAAVPGAGLPGRRVRG